MNATAELDKSGRLVVPKKIREAMGLRPGDNLDIEIRDDEIVLRSHPKGKGLHKDDGLWVYDSGAPLSTEDVNRWIQADRERRMRFISGESLNP